MVKNPLANAGDAKVVGWIPGSGRSLGGGNGSLLQYTCLENSKGKRSLPGYSPWGHKESDTACKHNKRQDYEILFSLNPNHEVATDTTFYRQKNFISKV